VMLLTPHIIRTRGIREDDLKPIYIGSAQNLGLGGPPPLIGGKPEAGDPAAPAAPPAPGAPEAGAPTTPAPVPTVPPVSVPPEPVPAPPPPAAAVEPVVTPGLGAAQVFMTPPGAVFRVGGGPYTIPISISDVSRLSTITLTILFDPALLRVRTVQEGSFMRSGGASASFTQQTSTPGRVDITITRASDATGASGAGLLAAILFDAVAPGNAILTLSGAGTGPGGTPMGITFRPVTIIVQ
jgi:hypothetical protein